MPLPPPPPGPGTPPEPGALPVVVVAPHQDDELLSCGAVIRSHVAAGREVLVLMIGRGNKSVVRTRDLPRLLGYVPSEEAFGYVRDREFERCVIALGATPVVPDYAIRLDERAFTPDAVLPLIRDWVPPGQLVTLARAAEPNPDHVAVHDAAVALAATGWSPQAPHTYVHCSRLTALDRAGIGWQREGLATPVLPEHQWPYREIDVDAMRWGVGYQSVPYSFEAQLSDPFAYRVGGPAADPAHL